MFLTFGTTRVIGRQPYAPAAFTPGEIPGTHFQRQSRPQGTWFSREPRKKSQVTPLVIDPGTCRLVAQCLNTTLPQAPLLIAVFLNRRAAAPYRALASIILGRERPEEITISPVNDN